MHQAYQTRGFVFKKEDRLDADRVFSVFTHDFGRIEVFAKAIRKITSKLRGGVEIFSFSDIEFVQGKNKKTLIDAVGTKKFAQTTHSPEKFNIAREISETVDNFIKGEQKDERILGLLVDSFEKLNQSPNFSLVYDYFFWNFIVLLGYTPQLSRCAACNQTLIPQQLYFSNKEGGVICETCATTHRGAIKIQADVVKILRIILKKDWQSLLKLKIGLDYQKELRQILNNYYAYLSSSIGSK